VKRRSAGKTRELSPWRSGTNMEHMEQVETKQLNKSRIPKKWDNIIQYMFLLSMSWLIFYSPFVRGMYFESEQRPAIIYTLFVFLLFWIYKWIKGEPTRFFRNKLDIALFALVAMYGLSFFWAVSKHDAIFEWLKYCMYFSVYYIISDIADTDKKKECNPMDYTFSRTRTFNYWSRWYAWKQIRRFFKSIFKTTWFRTRYIFWNFC
jgi:hypothetical protein